MNLQDRIYFQGVLDDFIYASIQRVARSNELVHRYRLTVDEVRQNTGRQRLHESVLYEIEAFFNYSNVLITYDRNFGTFDIILDLSRCALNQAQARFLSTAMEVYRSEN